MNVLIKVWLCCLSFAMLSAMEPSDGLAPAAHPASGVLTPADTVARPPKAPKSTPARLLASLKMQMPFSPSGPEKIIARAEEKLDMPNPSQWSSASTHLKNAVAWLVALAKSPSKRPRCLGLADRAQRVAVRKLLQMKQTPRQSLSTPRRITAEDHALFVSNRETTDCAVLLDATKLLRGHAGVPGIHRLVALDHIKGGDTGGGHILINDDAYVKMVATTRAVGQPLICSRTNGIIVGWMNHAGIDGQPVCEQKTMFPYGTLVLSDGTRFVTTPDHIADWAQSLGDDWLVGRERVDDGYRVLGTISIPGSSVQIAAEMVEKRDICVTMYPVFSYVQFTLASPMINLAHFTDENGREGVLAFAPGDVLNLMRLSLRAYEAQLAQNPTAKIYNPVRYNLTSDLVVDIAPQLQAAGHNCPVNRGIFVRVDKTLLMAP